MRRNINYVVSEDLFEPSLLTIKTISPKGISKQWKQPSRGAFIKRCSENMQQIYRRTPMPKCDFNKVVSINFNKDLNEF